MTTRMLHLWPIPVNVSCDTTRLFRYNSMSCGWINVYNLYSGTWLVTGSALGAQSERDLVEMSSVARLASVSLYDRDVRA